MGVEQPQEGSGLSSPVRSNSGTDSPDSAIIGDEVKKGVAVLNFFYFSYCFLISYLLFFCLSFKAAASFLAEQDEQSNDFEASVMDKRKIMGLQEAAEALAEKENEGIQLLY